MDDLLQKLKLTQQVDFILDTNKETFIQCFKKNVDDSDLSFSDSLFEAFKGSKNEYKGNITRHSFQLRRRQKLFDSNKKMFALVYGEFFEKESQLIINTKITGFHKSMKFMYAFILTIYVIFLIGFALSFSKSSDPIPLFALPFLLLHAALMLGIPYLLMRRSVQRMKYELQRDFHFWIK